MITSFETPWQPDQWLTDLKSMIRQSTELLHALDLAPTCVDFDPDFPLRVPREFVDRMQVGDPNDPLLRQVLPTLSERVPAPDFVADPLAEADAIRAPGLVQKYQGRALLITTPACAVHCRYCFRRHFPYDAHGPQHHRAAIDEVMGDPTLQELILSGGDPLVLKDQEVARLFDQLNGIDHLRRLRIHTRMPVVMPTRVTPSLLRTLADTQAKVVVVVHVNHANELNHITAQAFNLLRSTGAELLNQAVLLRGINDSADALVQLSNALIEQGVHPYYLHLPDRVEGTQHFFVGEAEARALHHQLTVELPGYLVPRLAQEVPGAPAKRLVS